MNLYEIISLSTGEKFTCNIIFNPEHPILKGHFPGNPVVPGAWLIRITHDLAEQVTRKTLIMKEASQVKFLKPIQTQVVQEADLEGQIKNSGGGSYQVSAIISVSGDVFMKFKGTFQEA